MHSSETLEQSARVKSVRVTDDTIVVDLVDGRQLLVPTRWFPRLQHATPAERADLELLGGGCGIHWPQLDEDLSVQGLLDGRRSMESEESLARWLAQRS